LIALKGNLTAKLVQRAPDKAVHEAGEIRDIANSALKRMRELVSDMKVVRQEEVWEQAHMLCSAANVKLEIQDGTNSGQFTLTPLQESVLAMCVREALTNVVRHSGASACHIELKADEEAIRCTVADNGKGRDPNGAA